MKARGSAATKEHPAHVCLSPGFLDLKGHSFIDIDVFLEPDAARALALDILKEADQADGGQGWQERLADALAESVYPTTQPAKKE